MARDKTDAVDGSGTTGAADGTSTPGGTSTGGKAAKTDIDAIARQTKGASRRQLWLLAGAVAVVCGGAVWWWLSGSGASAASFTTAPVTRTDLVVAVTATGTVEPTNKVEISSELSGTVRSVEVDFNDPVTVGQILARLDTDKLEATVEHGRAMLASAQARQVQAQTTLDETRTHFDRVRELERRGTATREALDTARAGFDRATAALSIAQADVRVAAADLRVSQANLEKACICSSINGVVLDRDVDVGQIVASSLQAPVLFTLADDLRQMELRVAVDEADIGAVKVGNPATFTVEAYQNRTFPAVIAALRYAPQTIDGVVTYEAVLSIENEDLLLRPGMTAVAEITVEQIKDTLVVPNAALRFSPPAQDADTSNSTGVMGRLFRPPSSRAVTVKQPQTAGKRTLWLLEDDTPREVQVTVGPSDGTMTQILDGDVSEDARALTDMQVAQ